MSKYTERFEAYTDGLEAISVGACSDCRECYDDWSSYRDGGPETFINEIRDGLTLDDEFSWSSCEACGSRLGGSRHVAHALDDGELVHVMVCVDCVMYIANGDDPEEN